MHQLQRLPLRPRGKPRGSLFLIKLREDVKHRAPPHFIETLFLTTTLRVIRARTIGEPSPSSTENILRATREHFAARPRSDETAAQLNDAKPGRTRTACKERSSRTCRAWLAERGGGLFRALRSGRLAPGGERCASQLGRPPRTRPIGPEMASAERNRPKSLPSHTVYTVPATRTCKAC